MKTITKILLTGLLLPLTLFAHEGHLHTGTFWETAFHYLVTKSWIAFIIGAIIFTLYKMRKKQTVKNK